MKFLVMPPCHACSTYTSLAISIYYNSHLSIQECSIKIELANNPANPLLIQRRKHQFKEKYAWVA